MQWVGLKRPLAPPRRAILVWLTVYDPPPKQGQAANRFSGPALAPHGIYARGKAIRALFDGLATRNHRVGSFETALGAAQAGGRFWCGKLYTKTPQNRDKPPIALAARH